MRTLKEVHRIPDKKIKAPSQLDHNSKAVLEHLLSRNPTIVGQNFKEVRLDYSSYDSPETFMDLKERGVDNSADFENAINTLEAMGMISTSTGNRDKMLIIRIDTTQVSRSRDADYKKGRPANVRSTKGIPEPPQIAKERLGAVIKDGQLEITVPDSTQERLSPEKIAEFKKLVNAPGFLLPIVTPRNRITSQQLILELVIAATDLPGFPEMDKEFVLSALARERSGKKILKQASILHNHLPYLHRVGVLESTNRSQLLRVSSRLIESVLNGAVGEASPPKITATEIPKKAQRRSDVKPTESTGKTVEKLPKCVCGAGVLTDKEAAAEKLTRKEVARFKQLINTPGHSLTIESPGNRQTSPQKILALLKTAVRRRNFPAVTLESVVSTLVRMGIAPFSARHNHVGYLCRIGVLVRSGWGKNASWQVAPAFIKKALDRILAKDSPSSLLPAQLGTDLVEKIRATRRKDKAAIRAALETLQKTLAGYDREISMRRRDLEWVTAERDAVAATIALLEERLPPKK